MLTLVHKKHDQWWVYKGTDRIGLIAKHSTGGDWIYRVLGFDTKPKPARTKSEAVARLINDLNGKS
jgi:hypothetical protein